MPGLVWDSSELSLLDEPLDTVLSDDIWKKFDLDDPLDVSHIHGHHIGGGSGLGAVADRSLPTMTMIMNSSPYDDGANSITLPEIYDKSSCHESSKIRHHDCMWAGLCISKEHNRTLPAKKDSQLQSRKVPAGRSLLISSRAGVQKGSSMQQQLQHMQQQQQQQQSHPQRCQDSLESDGDSARPETPQSSESESESEAEDDDDVSDEDFAETKVNVREPIAAQRRISPQHQSSQQSLVKQETVDGPLVFRHEQISINEKLTECMNDETRRPKAAPVSEVTGQLVRQSQSHERIKVEDEHQHREINGISSGNEHHGKIVVKKETDNWYTLSDHCYHQPSSKNLEHLGVQTPSDSEEEIDVVTFEKPCRPAVLPTYPSIADQQHFQLTVNSALKEKPATAPRPRGRPPSSGTPRKRSAQPDQKPAKRPRHRNYQRRSKVTKNSPPPTPIASPQKVPPATAASASSRSSGSSDDEPDTEKRSLHNNMERQRRIELRNAFEELRVLVPEVEAKEKAPKVAILRQAAVYCDMLTEIGQVTLARVTEMKKRQERLRAKLSQLRRNLAMTR